MRFLSSVFNRVRRSMRTPSFRGTRVRVTASALNTRVRRVRYARSLHLLFYNHPHRIFDKSSMSIQNCFFSLSLSSKLCRTVKTVRTDPPVLGEVPNLKGLSKSSFDKKMSLEWIEMGNTLFVSGSKCLGGYFRALNSSSISAQSTWFDAGRDSSTKEISERKANLI